MQYNLFAGTVLGLGGPDQVAVLDEMQDKGELGCFGLTERCVRTPARKTRCPHATPAQPQPDLLLAGLRVSTQAWW